jgi:hypothetical protein
MQINDYCIQTGNDLTMNHTFPPPKKEMNVAPHRVGAITEHQSMDHNPSSPRVPGYGRGCLAVSWRLAFYEVCIKIEGNALLWEI